MKTHAIRLTYGQDLKKEIENICKQKNIQAGYVASSVGCVYEIKLRMAGGKTFKQEVKDYEIINVNGTLSKDGVHLHISLSDIDGNVVGGHLCEGCLINTTCELILVELDEYTFTREFDEKTGYKELNIH